MAEKPREALIRLRSTSSVIRKIAFFRHPVGHKGNICALSESFNAKNFVAEFHRVNASFTRKTAN